METRICSQCGLEKPLKDFHKNYSVRKDRTPTNKGRRANCRICENKRRRESYIKHPETGMLSNIKQRCRKYNIPFNLTLKDIIIPEYCPILEVKLSRGTQEGYANSPTIDRIIPEKGYIKGNIKVISMLANKMKNNATIEQLKLFSKNILSYMNDDIV